jgi:polar amino acid transport system permease protein
MEFALPGMNMSFATMMGMLGDGIIFTAIVFVVTLVGAVPLGVFVCACRTSKFKPLALLARFYISLMRGTPLMLQLFVWMFGPYYLLGLNMGTDWKYYACCVGFILNYAAYFAEIYRSGIQSIPLGQYEACDVLGYSKPAMFFKIILPQVVKRIIPAMGNEIITLVKDTSLAFVLSIAEMFTAAKAIAASQVSMWPYAIAALIYWVINLVIEMILTRVEKKMSYYHD